MFLTRTAEDGFSVVEAGFRACTTSVLARTSAVWERAFESSWQRQVISSYVVQLPFVSVRVYLTEDVSARRLGTTSRECIGTVPGTTVALTQSVLAFRLKSLLVPVHV